MLNENPDPSEAQIREAISGQLCRCTGYENIVKAIRWAALAEAAARQPGAEEPVNEPEGAAL